MNRLLLVGDNPFHEISHLSQARARSRSRNLADPAYCAELILEAKRRGANGFMFSVSQKTLAITRYLSTNSMGEIKQFFITPIIPYAFEYVRRATQVGASGLIRDVAANIVKSGNLMMIAGGLNFLLRANTDELIRLYIDYELNRLKASIGRYPNILFLHELVVDTLIPYGLINILVEALEYIRCKGIVPGIETRNLPIVYRSLDEYIDASDEIVFAAPFNKIGFQMSPSREEYERLVENNKVRLIAFSILAAGYLKPDEALEYIKRFKSSLLGVSVGISKRSHASIFHRLRNIFYEGFDGN